ncbi:uncharacterized protein LOC107624946 [Arachis ipaensis]|uniref:uncharacterized protein LOC107624946 n=1 Tax=Arachis ipaensis TaxID=130454 RepID=UPI000A2B4F34|nr:uncharacterized protein LOC107624946 [Arachis ipaensis]
MLYRNGYENDSSCHVCGTSCYIEHHVEADDVTSSRKPRKARTPKKKRKVQPTALVQECEHNGNGTMFEVEKNSKTRNQRTAELDAMEQNDINFDDDGEDINEMSATSNKKGTSLDMYFKVHEINLEDEKDEEDEENELDDDDANDAGSGGQASNEAKVRSSHKFKALDNAGTLLCMEKIQMAK